jgi:hypothetical protein
MIPEVSYRDLTARGGKIDQGVLLHKWNSKNMYKKKVFKLG